MKERTWDDLPWAAHPVTLIYPQRRVVCRRCGIRTEGIEFADAKARVTRRLRQQIGVDCQSTRTATIHCVQRSRDAVSFDATTEVP
jgi:transposase